MISSMHMANALYGRLTTAIYMETGAIVTILKEFRVHVWNILNSIEYINTIMDSELTNKEDKILYLTNSQYLLVAKYAAEMLEALDIFNIIIGERHV